MATSEHGKRRFDDHPPGGGDDWRRGSGWSESARQVWLAGVGAWTRAQEEGGRLFEGLVRDGLEAERQGARHGDTGPSRGRTTEDVRGFANGAWDRMGQFVEDSVQRAMLRLGVPRREDLDALGRRIDALSAELRDARAAGMPGTATPARRRSATAAAKTATATATTAKPTTAKTNAPARDPDAASRKPPA